MKVRALLSLLLLSMQLTLKDTLTLSCPYFRGSESVAASMIPTDPPSLRMAFYVSVCLCPVSLQSLYLSPAVLPLLAVPIQRQASSRSRSFYSYYSNFPSQSLGTPRYQARQYRYITACSKFSAITIQTCPLSIVYSALYHL